MSESYFRIPDFNRVVAWLKRGTNALVVTAGLILAVLCTVVYLRPNMLVPVIDMLTPTLMMAIVLIVIAVPVIIVGATRDLLARRNKGSEAPTVELPADVLYVPNNPTPPWMKHKEGSDGFDA